jgi:hypothetical protein
MAATKKQSLQDSVKKNFPQFSYLFEQPELFGQDMLDLFKKAVKSGYTPERFRGELQKTTYWQTTVSAAKNFDAAPPADQQTKIDSTLEEIKGVTDIDALPPEELSKFTRDMARRGVSGENLKRLAYGLVFKNGLATQAATEALNSSNAMGIRKIAKEYGYNIDDATVQSYLEKGESPESVTRKYIEKAKGLHPHLAPQFDAGLTFEDIVSDYQRVAASVLEKSASEIDFTKPQYMEAIATRDDKGNTRQLSLSEWQSKLKTDDKYGYSKTKTAIQDARTLASSIAKSFGKVI